MLDIYLGLWYYNYRKRKELIKMKYIITYTSYMTYHDHEIYWSKEEAEKRYEKLAKCKDVSKLEMREI